MVDRLAWKRCSSSAYVAVLLIFFTTFIDHATSLNVKFASPTYVVIETDGVSQPELVLSESSSTAITVQVIAIDITATGGVDYNSGPYNVTFPAGVTMKSFNVAINNDDVLEDTETFNLTLAENSLPKNITLGKPYLTEVTILNIGGSITVSFNQSTYIVNENEGLLQAVLVLSKSAEDDIAVQVITNDSTATGGGVDYNSGPYNVTFPAGVTSASLNITINDDNVLEYNETFNLIIINDSLPKNFILGEIYITEVTILSDGGTAVSISFNQSTYVVNETEGLVEVMLILNSSIGIDITVQVKTNDNTATGRGVDYNSGTYNVTFPAGVTSVSLNITINNDTVLEYDETFNLIITADLLPQNIVLGQINFTKVTIVNDGSSGKYAVNNYYIVGQLYVEIQEFIKVLIEFMSQPNAVVASNVLCPIENQ